jgi:phosphoglycerol transferase MdoB-like AlkP superfamily enzyme
MKKLLKRLPAPVQYVLLIYASGMLVFLFFRILLLLLHAEEAAEIPAFILFKSLLMGFRFDAVISGYLLALPAALFFLFSFSGTTKPALVKVISAFVVTVYAVAFFIHVADVRWYGHGAARVTVSALQWTDTPGWMLKFVFQDLSNYPFIALLILLIFFFHRLVKKIGSFSFANQSLESGKASSTAVYLVLLACMFIGIRGRLAIKSPIRWGTAFFSQHNFANQLGLNPVFTFIRSWLDQRENRDVRYNFMDTELAEEIVRRNMSVGIHEGEVSPVARKITPAGNPRQYNVVVVLMESMSAKNMRRFGNRDNLTPVLDSLFDRAISFTDFYSDGNHTFNGIFSSLYGFHSLPMVHHMKDIAHQQSYGGLSHALLSRGYETLFFTTHDDQFDNMAGFLLPNGFKRIVSERDYDSKYVLSTLGVPDHIMFERVIRELDGLEKNNAPFFAAMISGSNHEPLVLPEDIPIATHSPGLEEKVVEYSDWAIGKFLSDAAGHSWFDSTVFVFTGDHGGLIGGFDHYLAFHHVPLIIYAPAIFPGPRVIEAVGGQADIYATVCGLLNLSYTNNSMGIDLINSRRNFYPFNFDEELCCAGSGYFFTIGHERELFYKISSDGKKLEAAAKTALADSMKAVLQATMQVTQRMIEERKMK